MTSRRFGTLGSEDIVVSSPDICRSGFIIFATSDALSCRTSAQGSDGYTTQSVKALPKLYYVIESRVMRYMLHI
jgi:hypothetical protein